MSTQIYYEHMRRNGTFQNETLDTVDFDFQHELAVVKNHEVSWGLGYRLHIERIKDAEIVSVSPSKRNLHLISAFLQDQIGLFDDKLTLTIGSKVEYHTLSDFEFQPNIRFMWHASSTQRFWAAFSRATRTPSRGEKDAQLNIFGIPRAPQDAPNKIVLHGNSDFNSEDVLSYELGYRTWFGDYFSFDIVTFYNDYDNLIFAELATITQAGEIPLRMTNDEKAKTWGVEISADWRPVDCMRLHLAYTYLRMDYEQKKNYNGVCIGNRVSHWGCSQS
jgi:iron complex outermembrane receptor protein